jgi:predicted DNA-binding protein
MKMSTVSSRITSDEIACLDELAERAGQDRAGIIKSIIRRGISELRLEQAVLHYDERDLGEDRSGFGKARTT